MKILVTGHKGFVGRHFYMKLCSMGHDVKGIDISDGISCEDFFDENTELFDYVYHFACYVDPEVGVKNIKTSNISYDLCLDSHLFSWAIRTSQKNIVYFSSSSVYPVSVQKKPGYKLKESDVDHNFEKIKKPDNIYGWTKLTGEFFLKYLRENGINTFIFRPFSIYGEDQNSSFIFRSLLDAVCRRDKVISIWGDGTQTRDFIYIKDVVDSVLKTVESGYETPINIGTGVPMSINEVLDAILSETKWRPSKINHLLNKDIGEKHRCADISLLKKIYKPKYLMSSVVRDFFKRI